MYVVMVEFSVRSPGAYHFGVVGGQVWVTWGAHSGGFYLSVRYIIYWCSAGTGLGHVAL